MYDESTFIASLNMCTLISVEHKIVKQKLDDPTKNFNPLPDDKILDFSKLNKLQTTLLTHSHTMTHFDAPGKRAF